MMHKMTKRYVAIIAVGLALVVAVVFRDRIGNLLTFRRGSSETGNPVPSGFPIDPEEEGGIFTDANDPDAVHALLGDAPPYEGRDPEELRPQPSEVAIFSEEERQRIYTDLQNQGKAVKESPQFFQGWLELGVLKKVIGDFEGARDAWEYAGRIRPMNSVSFANLGELYWRYLPDFPASEKNFRSSIANDPADAATYISLAELYFYSYREKYGLFDDVLIEGMTANPESQVNLMKELAHLYEREGSTKKALEWWERVLREEPDNAEVAAAIAALRKKL